MQTSTAIRYGLATAVVMLLAGSGAALLTGRRPDGTTARPGDTPRLVAFTSCSQLLDAVRAAAGSRVGGPAAGAVPPGAEPVAPAGAGSARAQAAAPDGAGADTTGGTAYSGTNTHEPDVDEPDLVKTDGRWIVTASHGRLLVVDAIRRRLTGSLDLYGGEAPGFQPADLLIDGDRVLVLLRGGAVPGSGGGIVGPRPVPSPGDATITGPVLLLVRIAGGQPSVLDRYTIDGDLVDARQTGDVVRVVLRSGPRLRFDQPGGAPAADANRAAVTGSTVADWLPRYMAGTGQAVRSGRVACAAVSRPTLSGVTGPSLYSGTSMLTVATFNLAAGTLGNGDPVSVIADGQTVYATGSRLYIAGTAWSGPGGAAWPGGGAPALPRIGVPAPPDGVPATGTVAAATTIYAFDTSGTGRPRYLAAGTVPGTLLNQYAMSEGAGFLRVATTGQAEAAGAVGTGSGVYVLARDGGTLRTVGRLTGLGRGERVYGVRFAGPVGYVVTFRQTDPLYIVDLRDPRRPVLAGELSLTGYSAYLHPVGDTRLIGVGQEADARGRTSGTQVSLFDVADPAAPRLLARYTIPAGRSEAEFDPHAFLYWPQTRLLVLPVTVPTVPGGPVIMPAWPAAAEVLTVDAAGFTERGLVTHPTGAGGAAIRRSLVTGGTLWTVSGAGLRADDVTTLQPLAWIPSS